MNFAKVLGWLVLTALLAVLSPAHAAGDTLRPGDGQRADTEAL